MNHDFWWYGKWLSPHAIGGYLIGTAASYFLTNIYLSLGLMVVTCVVYSLFISWIQSNFTNLFKKD